MYGGWYLMNSYKYVNWVSYRLLTFYGGRIRIWETFGVGSGRVESWIEEMIRSGYKIVQEGEDHIIMQECGGSNKFLIMKEDDQGIPFGTFSEHLVKKRKA